MSAIAIPSRPRGRPSAASNVAYEAAMDTFANDLLEIDSTLEFGVSARGWCYLLEEHGLGKGDFDHAQRLINVLRKDGRLPVDFVTEDGARAPTEVDPDVADDESIEDAAEYSVDKILAEYEDAEENARDSLLSSFFTQRGYWDAQSYYVEMFVEKVDLRTLFAGICESRYVRITNAKGWSDINSRAALLRRMQDHANEGRTPVLLYCGDHDPVGLSITDHVRENLRQVQSTRWRDDFDLAISVGDIIVDRFGLNADFIEANGLTWIDGLETSSGGDLASPRHADHFKPHVQDYLAKFGARKCEANALVVRPAAARQLCQDVLDRYFDADAEDERCRQNQEMRERVVVRQIALAADRGFEVNL